MTLIVIILLTILITSLTIAHLTKPTVHIPFKESMDLINLPVVTFINNNVKLHFLLDTGSDDSFITSSITEMLDIKSTDSRITNIQTGNGIISSLGRVTLDISYLDSSYENTFIVSDLDGPFSNVANSKGIQIHGILGSLFFRKYGYKLDFKKLAACK
jgi:hypothetical protein